MQLDLKNVEQIQRVLKGLSEPLKTKILKKALTLISKPILESAKAKVWSHQRKGRLYRSLGQQIKKGSDGGYMVILGARKKGKYRGSHAHFLENGTKQRSYITKNGVKHSTGRTRGIKYWSTSVEEGSRKSENDFKSYIVTALEKEVNALYRKVGK